MGKFQSELHTLCEQSKWDELCLILNAIVEFDKEEEEDARRDNNNGTDGESRENEDNKDGNVNGSGRTSPDGTSSSSGRDNNDEHHPYVTSTITNRRHSHLVPSHSSFTCATTAPSSTNFNDSLHQSDRGIGISEHSANTNNSNNNNHSLGNSIGNSSSSSPDSFEDDLRCSYEKLLPDDDGFVDGIDDSFVDHLRPSYENPFDNSMRESNGDDSSHSSGKRRRKRQGEQKTNQTSGSRTAVTLNQDGKNEPTPIKSNTLSDSEKVHHSQSLPNNNPLFSHSQITTYKSQLTTREGPNSWTPLMIASVSAPPSIIALLIKACPKACSVPDKSGSLPLHLVCCWRRSRMLMQKNVEGRDIDLDSVKEEYKSRRRRRQNSNVKQCSSDDNEVDKQHELCQVIYMLVQAYPDSLATVNRWKQTPLHSLFESKEQGSQQQQKTTITSRGSSAAKGNGRIKSEGACLVQTLLGMWHDKNIQLSESFVTSLQSNNAAGNEDKSENETKQSTASSQIIQSAINRSLRARDSKGRLPLHCAATCPWVTEAQLRALVKAFPVAAYIPVLPSHGRQKGSLKGSLISFRSSSNASSWDVNNNALIQDEDDDGLFPKIGGYHEKDLAVHLLHRRLLSPITAGDETELWSRSSGLSNRTDASVFLKDDHCSAISALLEPLVEAANQAENLEARLACSATGSGSHVNIPQGNNSMPTLLPLHIAALHGVSHSILEGLCRAYPEGAMTPMISPLHNDRLHTLPIELFEEGRAGHEVNSASDGQFLQLSAEYFRRSDLLFSYHPEAVSSKKVVYCRDEARLTRFEQLIKKEAQWPGQGDGLLSDMAGSVWLFLCRSAYDESTPKSRKASLPNFGAIIGRILLGLDQSSVLRLHFLRTTSIPEGVRVPPLANGRTVLEEAKERAPNGSLGRMMLEEHFFHCTAILGFLGARDALAYSATCRKAWTRGVRLLPRIRRIDTSKQSMDFEGQWRLTMDDLFSETSSQEMERGGKLSGPWQKLELPYVPSCTHTVFISCNVTYQRWDSSEEEDGCEGGGLLVLSEDATSQVPDLVVASIPVPAMCVDEEMAESRAEEDDDGEERQFKSPLPSRRVRFSFNHQPGHSYTLWYYGSERHTLIITNLTVRQLVYSCDYNGHNPLHVLLCEGDNPSNLKEQLSALIAVGFGSNLPIHYALKVGVLERTLRCLIEANPAALLDTDEERRTPLHAALSGSRMPSFGIVQALLTSPGVNATHLKDKSGKLPIHLAAEGGGGEALLRVLVDAYVDGCYRRTDEGDLPLHLLVRSGSATEVTVELLMRPIIHNPTICAYPGSLGVNLPLYIAAEYRCEYSIFEGLLSSYSQAAHTKRQIFEPDKNEGRQQKKDPRYALEIFEEGRAAECMSSKSKASIKTESPLGEADFNLRSDLIFVHNPNVPKSTRPYLTTYYRDEKDRIMRLAAAIKREAHQCSKNLGREEERTELTEMAQLAWCWMCSNNHYAEVISDIVHALPVDAVRFLALTENPKSEPVSHVPIKDCAAPRCALIMKSRLSFLGRYILDGDSPLIHKSDSCVILRARDIGAMDSYLSIQTLLSNSDPDIDDYSHSCGSVYAITGNSIELERFAHFARKIGVDQNLAVAQIERLLLDSSDDNIPPSAERPNLKESGVKKSGFTEFCKLHGIDDEGCRIVVIKFMRSKQSFELEKQCRDILRESGKSSHVVPILNHFSFGEGDGKNRGNSNDFTRDIFGSGPPSMNLSGLNYGIVMPCANGDLRDIIYREGLSSSNIRENARQVGETLQALHLQGITHMNLQMKNVLQFGKKMVLSDFGSALFLKSINGVNALGGSSVKICPSILPPEMIAKIELSNRDSFDQLMRYWKYVHVDANDLRALTPHERDAISKYLESHNPKPSLPQKAIDEQSWKDGISSLLDTIKFEDLPIVLSKCTSFNQFCAIWDRMRVNYNLWATMIRPRVDEQEKCVYMIKSFENRNGSPPRDASTLPYSLVSPSEKVDVWTFGIFIFELCSGGNPFHTGYQGDLRGVDSYSKLYEWDKPAAQKSVREHVQDPLAQDLLCQILVPAEERLPSIAAALEHPFFSPKSVEAERFLEKHEEMQLLQDNTVSVSKITKSVATMLDDSIEKYCKIAFATEQIAFPCCLMVLPYTLNFDESINRPVAAANPRLLSCAVKLGECLLEINKATAKLSFWLMMSAKMRGQEGDEFKSQMQEWLKRARYESCASIALEIVTGLGCGTNYAMICEEVLAFDGSISKAKSYMRDPIAAAKKDIRAAKKYLSALYQSLSYLYLVDEAAMVPSCPTKKNPGTSYPIQLRPNPKLIATVLLPFMNIVVMKALARDKFEGLARLLGLPPSLGIPDSWRSSEPGLLHSTGNSASIEEFVFLQKILRKDDLNAFKDDASIMSQSYHSANSAYDTRSYLSFSALGLANMDLSPGDPMVAAVPMAQLELLFRERDPDREFGRLRRVTSASQNKGLGIWTSVETIRQLKSMVEVAELEDQLRELKTNLDQTQSSAAQYATLLNKRKAMKRTMPENAVSPLRESGAFLDNSFDEPSVVPSVASQGNSQVSKENSTVSKQHSQHSHQSGEHSFSRASRIEEEIQDERESDLKQYPVQTLEISTHRMPDSPCRTTEGTQTTQRMTDTTQTDPHLKTNPEEAGMQKKMRKSKRRFRPWFTAC